MVADVKKVQVQPAGSCSARDATSNSVADTALYPHYHVIIEVRARDKHEALALVRKYFKGE